MADIKQFEGNLLTVVGIDLAMKTWHDNGSAMLSFTRGDAAAWQTCETDVIAWPSDALSSQTMAQAIDRFMLAAGANAVSLDGPQDWRDPRAKLRKGVGRLCEYEARTPGKTGVFGVVYPANYLGWVSFCIGVFHELLALPHVVLVNDGDVPRLHPLPTNWYYVLECFPTSTWRTSGLSSLPGHRKASPTVVETYADELRQRYQLPRTAVTDHHDHLQAIVAALPAAGLLGGPCKAVPRGEAAHNEPAMSNVPAHLVEGYIWDALP